LLGVMSHFWRLLGIPTREVEGEQSVVDQAWRANYPADEEVGMTSASSSYTYSIRPLQYVGGRRA